MANPIIKWFFLEHMIFYPGLCGHFALSTLLETCLEDAVFEISVTSQFHKKTMKIPTCYVQFDKNIIYGVRKKYSTQNMYKLYIWEMHQCIRCIECIEGVECIECIGSIGYVRSIVYT